MKHIIIHHDKGDTAVPDCGGAKRRMILFFAGWGMDASVCASLSKPGYDIMLVYDYRTDDFDISLLDGYDEICVLAWSLGVWHAHRFMTEHPGLPFTRAIAVNGTLNPVNDSYGIPERIYDLTSRLPDSNALQKFFRRICGGQSQMQQLMPRLPQRGVDELRDELLAVRRRIPVEAPSETSLWDEIYLSDSDLIFPFDNMMRAWESAAERVTVMHGASHAVDFNALIAGAFVDKALVTDRFASAAVTYEREAEVQRNVADIMAETAAGELRDTAGKKILEVGSGTGVLTKRYQPLFRDSEITLWDLAPATVESINGNAINVKACDAETELRLLPDGSSDTFFSSSTIQWFNSPRRFLREVVRVLAPGAMAFISCYVDGTIPELAMIDNASPMHYPHLDDILPTLPDVDTESFTREFELTFPTAAEALAHMRATGVNSLARNAMPVASTRRLMNLLTVDGKAVLKFNTKFIIIRKHG